MQNVNLLANELHNAGFRTKVLTSNTVRVDLSTRKPSTQEVEAALEQIFDGIQFNVRSTADAVWIMNL